MVDEWLLDEEVKKKKRRVLVVLVGFLCIGAGGLALFGSTSPSPTGIAQAGSVTPLMATVTPTAGPTNGTVIVGTPVIGEGTPGEEGAGGGGCRQGQSCSMKTPTGGEAVSGGTGGRGQGDKETPVGGTGGGKETITAGATPTLTGGEAITGGAGGGGQGDKETPVGETGGGQETTSGGAQKTPVGQGTPTAANEAARAFPSELPSTGGNLDWPYAAIALGVVLLLLGAGASALNLSPNQRRQ